MVLWHKSFDSLKRGECWISGILDLMWRSPWYIQEKAYIYGTFRVHTSARTKAVHCMGWGRTFSESLKDR